MTLIHTKTHLHGILTCRIDDNDLGPYSANALLIAAAPELLEALEEMETLFFGENASLDNWDARFFRAKGKAKSAIAKARGEEGR